VNVIRIIAEAVGDHVHVSVRTGSEELANGGRMPLAGTLVFRREDWEGFRRVLEAGVLVPRSEGVPIIDIMDKVP
jgi:DNA replicative helicase MCM subunit Mcm2 (Cdc46/Mcm family)